MVNRQDVFDGFSESGPPFDSSTPPSQLLTFPQSSAQQNPKPQNLNYPTQNAQPDSIDASVDERAYVWLSDYDKSMLRVRRAPWECLLKITGIFRETRDEVRKIMKDENDGLCYEQKVNKVRLLRAERFAVLSDYEILTRIAQGMRLWGTSVSFVEGYSEVKALRSSIEAALKSKGISLEG